MGNHITLHGLEAFVMTWDFSGGTSHLDVENNSMSQAKDETGAKSMRLEDI